MQKKSTKHNSVEKICVLHSTFLIKSLKHFLLIYSGE